MRASARQSIGCLPPFSHGEFRVDQGRLVYPLVSSPATGSLMNLATLRCLRCLVLSRVTSRFQCRCRQGMHGSPEFSKRYQRKVSLIGWNLDGSLPEKRRVFAREEMARRALGLGHRRPAGLPLAGRRDGAQLRSRLPPQLNWRSYRIPKCLDLCQSDAQPSCIKLK